MKSLTRTLRWLALCLGAFLVAACGPESQTGTEELPETDSLSTAERGLEKVVLSLPPPAQVLGALKGAGARYERSLLSPDSKASSYTTSRMQALNLGVYSADLAFAAAFDQSQDAVRYYLAVQKLAQPLGVGNIFSQELARQVEAQKSNPEALVNLASEAFRKANMQLKANGQQDAATLILLGGWIEGLHIATGMYRLAPSDELGQQIAFQKHALPNVMALYTEAGADKVAELKQLTALLSDLEAAFGPITFDYNYQGIETDSTKRLTRIDNSSKASYTAADIDAISKATEALRTHIVQ